MLTKQQIEFFCNSFEFMRLSHQQSIAVPFFGTVNGVSRVQVSSWVFSLYIIIVYL